MGVLHGDHDFDDDVDDRRRDKEISLGTSTMLGIFFLLTLLLAGFFAFGYSMGRKSALTAAGATEDGTPSGSSDAFKTFKPSPGTAAIQASNGFSAKEAAAANAAAGQTVVAPLGPPLKLSGAGGKTPPPAPAPVATAVRPRDPDAGIVGDPIAAPAAAPVKPGIIPVALGSAAAAKPAPAAGGAGTMVQVSAFTRQEDADVVVSALKRKGYNVFIRREPQDNYLHVQLGPYGSRKEAEAMKEKLSSDGFNAMVK